MNEKEAIKNVKEQLEGIKKANECGLATRGEFNKDIEAIETVLNLLENKDKQIEQYLNMLATNDMLHVLECEKKDKIIKELEEKLSERNMEKH